MHFLNDFRGVCQTHYSDRRTGKKCYLMSLALNEVNARPSGAFLYKHQHCFVKNQCKNHSTPENSAMSQPLKRNNPCQAAVAETSACPAAVQNPFPAAGMFSHSDLVVGEISSNEISQALLLSKTACGQRALFSAALCTCKSKGPGTVPRGWAGHRGQALSIAQGMRCLQRWPNPNTSLFWDTDQGFWVFYPGCPRLPDMSPKSHVPSEHLVSLCCRTGNFLSLPSLLACLLWRAALASVRLFAPA